jgi:phosphatidylserine/phosphatidylglycerophosphate/cardiolipin synthase-like enzyme
MAWLLALLISFAHATTYPWVNLRPNQLYFFHGPRVEQAVRLKLIRSAQRSIDLAIYDQRTDSAVAMPILKALRDAANRGVKVRFLTAWHASYAGDIRQEAPRYLTEPPTKNPIDYILFGGTELEALGWRFSDTVHHKQLIVDGEITLTTGRGHAEVYLKWIDTAALIRGLLLVQTMAAFERAWKIASAYRKPYARKRSWFSPDRAAVPEFVPDEEKTRIRGPEVDEYLDAAQFMGNPDFVPPGLRAGSVIRARTLYHDMLEQLDQLPKRPTSYDFDERAKILKDPVIDALLEKLAKAKDVRINTLSVILLPRVREALGAAARRGAKVEIFTDGKAAVETIVPGAPPWTVSLPELEELLAAGVKIFSFEPKGGWEYLHRKLAFLDDTTFYGSHNYNLPSTTANDELSYEFESAELTAFLRKTHEHDLAQYGVALSLEKIRAEREKSTVRRWFFRNFLDFF